VECRTDPRLRVVHIDQAMPHDLQHRHITIVRDDAIGEEMLEIEVRGGRGVGGACPVASAESIYRSKIF
jgi:hypothetical protein